MARRVYWETIKSNALKIGIPSGIAGFALLFFYLSSLGVIQVIDYSHDSVCAGTPQDPCIAIVQFVAKEDIFIYPVGYDPWGRNTPFDVDNELKSWKIYRSWGEGWREIKLDQPCTATWCGAPPDSPDNKYAFAFRAGKEYTIKIEAMKKNPNDTVKWGFTDQIDPFWYGINATANITISSTLTMELGSNINLSANLTGISAVCVNVSHPDYGANYTCGYPNANFDFNISYFRKTEFNDSSETKNITWVNNGCYNTTVYIRANEYDEIVNTSINVTGYIANGTFPIGVKIYINNTLSNTLGSVFSGNITINELSEGSTEKNVTFSEAGTKTVYLKIPKYSVVNSAEINLSGYKIYGDAEEYVLQNANTENLNDTWTRSDLPDTNYGTDTTLQIQQQTVITTYAYIEFDMNDYPDIDSTALINSTLEMYVTLNGNSETLSTIAAWEIHDWYWDENTATYNNPPSPDGDLINSTKLVLAGNWQKMNVTAWTDYCHKYNNSCTYKLVVTKYGVNPATLVVASKEYVADVSKRPILRSTFVDFSYPTDPYLEVGIPDGLEEWYHTGEFNESFSPNRTEDFSDAINTFLDSCTADEDDYCIVPLYFTSSTVGQINITAINVTYEYKQNPVYLNTDLISDFLRQSSGFADIPIKFVSEENGTLQIDDIRFDYAGGNDTIQVTVFNPTDPGNSETINLINYYSNWNYSFPAHVNWLEFIPPTPTSINVTPHGQTSTTSIFNITNLGYGGKESNFSVYLNETHECVNLTLSTTSNKGDGILLGPAWTDIYVNFEFLENFNIWMWADYSCNYSTWNLWEPGLFFRNCCEDCDVCTEELT